MNTDLHGYWTSETESDGMLCKSLYLPGGRSRLRIHAPISVWISDQHHNLIHVKYPVGKRDGLLFREEDGDLVIRPSEDQSMANLSMVRVIVCCNFSQLVAANGCKVWFSDSYSRMERIWVMDDSTLDFEKGHLVSERMSIVVSGHGCCHFDNLTGMRLHLEAHDDSQITVSKSNALLLSLLTTGRSKVTVSGETKVARLSVGEESRLSADGLLIQLGRLEVTGQAFARGCFQSCVCHSVRKNRIRLVDPKQTIRPFSLWQSPLGEGRSIRFVSLFTLAQILLHLVPVQGRVTLFVSSTPEEGQMWDHDLAPVSRIRQPYRDGLLFQGRKDFWMTLDAVTADYHCVAMVIQEQLGDQPLYALDLQDQTVDWAAIPAARQEFETAPVYQA